MRDFSFWLRRWDLNLMTFGLWARRATRLLHSAILWCRKPGSNRYEMLISRDFKSRASANSAIPACCDRAVFHIAYIFYHIPCQKSTPFQIFFKKVGFTYWHSHENMVLYTSSSCFLSYYMPKDREVCSHHFGSIAQRKRSPNRTSDVISNTFNLITFSFARRNISPIGECCEADSEINFGATSISSTCKWIYTQEYRSGHNEAVLKICRSSGSKSVETPWFHWLFRDSEKCKTTHI